MKRILGSALIASALMLGSCTGESEYNQISADLCTCMEGKTSGISNGMVELMEKSANDPAYNLEEGMFAYMLDSANAEVAQKDVELVSTLDVEVQSCISDMEKKHGDKITFDSESEVYVKFLKALEAQPNCRMLKALMKIGKREMDKQGSH